PLFDNINWVILPDDTGNDPVVGFGSVATGTTETFNIKNLGDTDLTIGTLTLGNDADFDITQPTVTTLPPGGVTTFTITPTNTQEGLYFSTVTIPSNDTDEGNSPANTFT
ncbi:MAG: hypothetical protein GTO22_23490, partial [Gemmatimonadales bacterium]|nr:hypothetical protein [Gemmatimonadales bacterium]